MLHVAASSAFGAPTEGDSNIAVVAEGARGLHEAGQDPRGQAGDVGLGIRRRALRLLRSSSSCRKAADHGRCRRSDVYLRVLTIEGTSSCETCPGTTTPSGPIDVPRKSWKFRSRWARERVRVVDESCRDMEYRMSIALPCVDGHRTAHHEASARLLAQEATDAKKRWHRRFSKTISNNAAELGITKLRPGRSGD